MAIPAEDYFARLPPERRAANAARGAELIEEDDSMRAIRALMAGSQADYAARFELGQEQVSELERGADAYLGMLRRYIKAAGGELDLIVRWPNRPTIKIVGLTGVEGPELMPPSLDGWDDGEEEQAEDDEAVSPEAERASREPSPATA